ncbi:MAG: DegT/DnrJ/EryC1/StrS family aminotransferase [Lachnospiraceae bacterium]|nr:DegT/DnrJ/EryC1/StrS family aminotransferase [Lachnospiraceae bacterium]
MDEKILVTQSSMPAYEEYIEAIKPLWESHWLTNMGKYHQELERQLKVYLDVPEISLMVNGHMALEMTIQAFDFPEGSEVITTPFTFVSTTHAIVRNRLCPVFCDIKESDGTMDEAKIEELITEKTVAILPVHVYGNVCNIEGIQRIADKYGLKVIYDAAHAFGVKYKGRGIGSYGDASVFSFHATKVFNTIEGGAAAFADRALYDKLYNLKNFGIRGEEHVVSIGANAKMNELQAIMGLCNLKHIGQALAARKERFVYYREHLQHIKGIRFFAENENASKNYAYFPILIGEDYPLGRDELYDLLKNHNIYARKYFYPITADMECYTEKYAGKGLVTARKLSEQVLTIPFYEKLEKEQMDRILELIC